MKEEVVLRMVKATRMAAKMSELFDAMVTYGEKNETMAHSIYGMLADALFYMSGEKLQPEQSFEDSRTWQWLHDPELSDGEVTMKFLHAEDNARKSDVASCSESISIIAEEVHNLKTWINQSANALTAKDIENRNLRETIKDVARTTCLHCSASRDKCGTCNVRNWARGEGK